MDNLYCLDNARTPQQLADMRYFEEKGICIFCPGSNGEYPYINVVENHPNWIIAENKYPHSSGKESFLFIPKVHVTGLIVTRASNLFGLVDVFTQCRKITAYEIMVKYGPMKATGATIKHLHYHLTVKG